MSTGLEDFGFETFGDPALERMLKAAQDYTRHVGIAGRLKGHWLSFLGRSGVGKTHLATRIFQFVKKTRDGERIIRAGRWTYFKARSITWKEFVDAIMSGKFNVVDYMIEPEFLFVDEVGDEAQGTREIVFSKFGNVANGRLGKWTVITGNQSLSQIASVDARIASRMIRMTDGGQNLVVDVGNQTKDYALREAKGIL